MCYSMDAQSVKDNSQNRSIKNLNVMRAVIKVFDFSFTSASSYFYISLKELISPELMKARYLKQ